MNNSLDLGKKMSNTMMMEHSPILYERWEYDAGLVLLGMGKISDLCGEGKYFDYIKKSMDYFVNEDGSINKYKKEEYNIDNVNNGKNLFYLYKKTGEEKYKKAIDNLLDQLKSHPRTKCGSFWHKSIYPNQIWLDGLYMAQPFRAEAGGEGVYRDILMQFKNVLEYTYEPSKDIYVHAYDEDKVQIWADKQTGRAPNAWGRALGWLCMAFVDVLEFVPKADSAYNELQALFVTVMEKVLKYQCENGAWKQVVDIDDSKNYYESSCSAMFTYALAKGLRLELLPSKMRANFEKAYQGVKDEFIRENNGLLEIHKVCQVAGLGGAGNRSGTFEYYMSEPIVINDFKGVGAFINMCAEVSLLNK